MREVEVKFLEVDTSTLVKKLIQLGAKKTFDGEISATYFDYPDSRLRKEGKLLRLRKKGDTIELTLKITINPDSLAKENEELEVNCTDYEMMQSILQEMGLEIRKKLPGEENIDTTNKHRASYSIGNMHFEFDTFPGVPTFLEIEAQSIQSIEEWVPKLGLEMKNAKPWTGRDVLKHYEKHIPPKGSI